MYFDAVWCIMRLATVAHGYGHWRKFAASQILHLHFVDPVI